MLRFKQDRYMVHRMMNTKVRSHWMISLMRLTFNPNQLELNSSKRPLMEHRRSLMMIKPHFTLRTRKISPMLSPLRITSVSLGTLTLLKYSYWRISKRRWFGIKLIWIQWRKITTVFSDQMIVESVRSYLSLNSNKMSRLKHCWSSLVRETIRSQLKRLWQRSKSLPICYVFRLYSHSIMS